MEMEKKGWIEQLVCRQGPQNFKPDCKGKRVEVKGNSEIPSWSIDCTPMLSNIVWYTKGKEASGYALDLYARRLNIR